MISVIICTYNRSRSLKTALDSLQKMHGAGDLAWELVVVDNNCRDDTEQVVVDYQRTAAFPVRYVRESEQGLSHARNRGITASRGEILGFTDDDVTVDAEWLRQLTTTYERFDCAGVGGRIVPVWTTARPAWLREDGPYAVMKAIPSFEHGEQAGPLTTPPFGANMSFRRSAFADHGLFRTDLGRRGAELMSGEDTEFGRRLLRRGERLVYDPDVVVYHHVTEERLTRAYFRRWYFHYGRTSVRLAAAETGGRHAPARLVRSLCAAMLRCLTATSSQGRFHAVLNLCMVVGGVREAAAATRQRHK